MFEYYQGYEIDGSDTSYNIIIPDKEKLIEAVNFYLSLKIIDKKTPVKIFACDQKKRHPLMGKEYSRGELDKLWEDLKNAEFFELKYKYVGPGIIIS